MRRIALHEPAVAFYRRVRRERHMPALLGLAVLLVGGLAVAGMAVDPGNKDEFQASALPEKVRAAVDRAVRVYPQPLRGVTWQSFRKLEGTDHALFQIQGRNERGNKVEAEITGAGRIIEVEEHGVPMAEATGPALALLKLKAPGLKLEKTEAIWQGEKTQPVAFGFEGEDKTGQKVELYIDADGKDVIN